MFASKRSVGFPLVLSITSLSVGWFAGRALHASYVARPARLSNQAIAATPSPQISPASAPASAPSLSERIDRASQKLENKASSTESAVVVFALAETLQADEFPAAIATTATLANLRGAQTMLFGYWMERDLQKALAWYEGLEASAQAPFSSALLQTWSAMDPQAALAWLEKQPEAARLSLVSSTQYILAQRVGPIEPDRVLALLATVQGDSGMIGKIKDGTSYQTGGNQSGVAIFFSALAAKAPADAAARALRLPSGTNRTSAALTVAKAWAAKDPGAAKAWAEKIDDAALAAQVIPACAIGLAQKDPKGAAEWLGEMAATLPNREGMKEVMAVWGQKDIEGALAWLDNMPEGSGAEELTGAVFKTLSETDPERMLRVAKARLDGGKPLDGEPRNLSLFSYAHSKGFKEALRIAEGDFQHPNSWASLQIYRSLVNGAAQDNPTETAAWALRQPGGDRRSEALELSATFLLKKDEEAAFRWIDALPRDNDSDKARQEAARGFFNDNQLEKAAALYLGMADREAADQELMAAAYWALAGKRPGYSEWLDKTPALSDKQKAEIRAQVNQRKR